MNEWISEWTIKPKMTAIDFRYWHCYPTDAFYRKVKRFAVATSLVNSNMMLTSYTNEYLQEVLNKYFEYNDLPSPPKDLNEEK